MFRLSLSLALAALSSTTFALRTLTATDLGLSTEEYLALPLMRGADFMEKGFDVTNDTVNQYVSQGGETARLPVYKWTFEDQNTYTSPYSKLPYKVPDQLSVTTDTQAMELVDEDISYKFSDVQTYEITTMNVGISLSYKNINAGVKYNQQMGKASDKMSNNSHVFAGSKKWWKMFDMAAYPPSLVGGVDPMLTRALGHLPKAIKTDADQTKYFAFVKSWGTHYIMNAGFGGKLKHNVYIETDFFKSRKSSYMSQQISLNFHYDAFSLSGGGFHNKSEIHMDQDYTHHSTSYLFYEGGLPALQTNETLVDWEATIWEAPHFLNATLSKISDLAEDPKTQQTLSDYIVSYLSHAGNPPNMVEGLNKKKIMKADGKQIKTGLRNVSVQHDAVQCGDMPACSSGTSCGKVDSRATYSNGIKPSSPNCLDNSGGCGGCADIGGCMANYGWGCGCC